MKWILASCLVVVMLAFSYAQTPTIMKDEKSKEPKESKKAKAQEEDTETYLNISLDMVKSAKITFDDKTISYTKFAALVEFAQHAFSIEEMTIRGGKVQSIHLTRK